MGALVEDPSQPWLIPYWTGALLLYSSQIGASDHLLEAARRAELAGAEEARLRALLLAARALAAVGRAASGQAILDELEGRVERYGSLFADHRLSLAACGHPDARRLWEEALPRLPSPARDADRLGVLLGLGILARGGGDSARARQRWEAALKLAQEHGDERERLRVGALLGNLLVEVGMPREAEPRLREVVQIAEHLGEGLVLLAEGTVLLALELGRQDWPAAEATAARCAAVASARNNPAAIADAAIARAACRLGQQDPPGAIRALWDAANLLRQRGSLAGLNLIRARLAELRVQLTPEVFDPLWAAVATGRG